MLPHLLTSWPILKSLERFLLALPAFSASMSEVSVSLLNRLPLAVGILTSLILLELIVELDRLLCSVVVHSLPILNFAATLQSSAVRGPWARLS